MPDFANLTHSTGAFIALVIGFGFLIFIHELGHFLVAKWVGIKVTQFAIGFGPSFFAWRKGIGFRAGSTEQEFDARVQSHLEKTTGQSSDGEAKFSTVQVDTAARELGLGETEYRLNWLPLGGYVKMLGQEDMDPTARSDDPRSFNTKPIWARACVVSAGVVMNLIFGMIFFIVAFMGGVKFPPAMVGSVVPGGAAATVYAEGKANDAQYLGLEPGDLVVAVDGKPATDFGDLATASALAKAGDTIRLTVERGDETLHYSVVPQVDALNGIQTVGITQPLSTTIGTKKDVRELPEELREAGVDFEMSLVSADGRPVTIADQMHQRVIAARGRAVPVTFEGDGKAVTVTVRAEAQLAASKDQRDNVLLGLLPATRIVSVDEKTPAEAAGIRGGDVLVRLGDEAWPTPARVFATMGGNGNAPISVSVLRDGQVVDLGPITPHRGRLGIRLNFARNLLLAGTQPGSAAADAMKSPPGGSRLLAVNGKPVSDWSDAQQAMQQLVQAEQRAASVELTYEVNVKDATPETAAVPIDEDAAAQIASAGWAAPMFLDRSLFEPLRIEIKADTPWRAVELGVHKTHQMMVQTYVVILRLFEGSVPLTGMSGPVGIATHGTAFAKLGFTYLLFFLGLISVNLVVINFLPIPIVDGGLMVFLIIEKIKGSPVSARVLNAANIVGLAMIGSLFLFVTFNDIRNLFP